MKATTAGPCWGWGVGLHGGEGVCRGTRLDQEVVEVQSGGDEDRCGIDCSRIDWPGGWCVCVCVYGGVILLFKPVKGVQVWDSLLRTMREHVDEHVW